MGAVWTLPRRGGIRTSSWTLALRLYGFGGAILIFRSERLSSDVLALAGTGGFEFFAPTSVVNAPVSYFIEIGGVGSGARAANLPGKPILLNGFVVQSGLRFYP